MNNNNFSERDRYGTNSNYVNLRTSDFSKKLLNCFENRDLVGKEVKNTKTIVNQFIDNGKANIELSKRLTNEINNLMNPFLHKNGNLNEKNILNVFNNISDIFTKNKDIINNFHISLFMNRLVKFRNIKYVIKLINNEYKSIDNIMKIISEKISSKDFILDSQSIGNIIYGLQFFEIDKYNILNNISRKISGTELDAQAIGNALYGLQNLKDVPEELLVEFARKIPGTELDTQAIGNALYGLHNIKDLDKSKEIIPMLFKKLNKVKHTLNDIDIIYIKQIFSYYDLHVPKWLKDNFMDYKKSNKSNPNKTEREVYNYLKGILKGEEILLCNYIDDGFELDIYFPKLKINIEIDSHYHDNKKNRNKKRDEHLKNKLGLNILRIDNRVGINEVLKFCTFEINKILNLSTI